MQNNKNTIEYTTPVLVIGGGIAGICTALELLDKNQTVLLIDRDSEEKFGGMANEAFGGMHFVDTPIQRSNGIKDNKQLALDDWMAAADFPDGDENSFGQQWANTYIDRNREDVYDWLNAQGIRFFPIVHWVERGDFGFEKGSRGNSVPRYHVAWGTGWEVAQTLIKKLINHPNKDKLSLKFNHKVTGFVWQNKSLVGCEGLAKINGKEASFSISADNTVICAGGINGNLKQVEKHWDSETYGAYPENMLCGSHPYADGHLHDEVQAEGGSIKNLGWMWNYASGVKHPKPEYENHGLSIMPGRSSLWMDALGNRVGPMPLITGFDTHNLCKVTGRLPEQYSWQVMNLKIARKELAASGSHINKAFRNKSWLGVIKLALLGNREIVQWLMDDCEDVVVADTLPELVKAMNDSSEGEYQSKVELSNMERDINAYDEQINRGIKLTTDDQIRKIHFLRQWKGDKARTLKSQKIIDEKAGPLIAIRSRIISRKSMGGFETNTQSQVVDKQGRVISGLYAAGEAAGFGGAGCAGIRSLEGTFLSLCILNGRIAAQTIAEKMNAPDSVGNGSAANGALDSSLNKESQKDKKNKVEATA
jgi:predicted oxidoreductase